MSKGVKKAAGIGAGLGFLTPIGPGLGAALGGGGAAAYEFITKKGEMPEEAPPPPTPDNKGAQDNIDNQLKAQAAKKGKASTILTPGYGFSIPPSSKKILLGA